MAKPVKLNTMSVGTLQFIPRSWHMVWFSVVTAEPYHAPPVFLVQQHRMAHQLIITAQKFIDFRHRRFAGDQFIDVAAEMLGQDAVDKDLPLAAFVDDFVAAEAQRIEGTVGAKFDNTVLLAVIDEVHVASFHKGRNTYRLRLQYRNGAESGRFKAKSRPISGRGS